MSLTQWLKSGTIKVTKPSTPGLPDPEECNTQKDQLVVQVANDGVDTLVASSPSTTSRKRKRGEYNSYDDNTRAKIARYAVDNGVAKAARKFTTDLGHKVSETSVRSMRDSYVKLKKKVGTEMSTLPQLPCGNPLALGDLDDNVKDWIRKVRLNGGVINNRIVMAAIEAIVTKFARHKLQRYGGHINVTKSLARSILQRMGFVKRKGTKSVKKLPSDFDEIKRNHLDKINKVVDQHQIPDSLIINWDQTGCQLVPGGDWTMEQQGTQQITISGLDDKRQITLLLAVSKSGSLLPPQLIYAGKTDRCLPKSVDFPDNWDITYSESHWSNEETMICFVDKVIIPYVEEIRDELPLVNTANQKAIALFDVYKAHQGEKLLSHLKKHDIIPLFVPAACTDKLQPLDLTLNREYKEELKGHDWYSTQVIQQLQQQEDETGDTSNNITVDTKTSVIKPIHANWIISTHQKMSTRADLIQMWFRQAGLL